MTGPQSGGWQRVCPAEQSVGSRHTRLTIMETKKPKKIRKTRKKSKKGCTTIALVYVCCYFILCVERMDPNMTAEQKAEFRIKEKMNEPVEIE